jgi:hydroxymethylpyrimidine/phosphomethylpyrimidine kinase
VKGRVFIIAGSDSGGGAGIQADIKTVTALGGYAMTAITALTAQNTLGVQAIHDVPADFVAAQMRAVLPDIGADCVKIGMLHRADVIDAVCAVLGELVPGVPLVVDPVMVAKGGHSLLAQDAEQALRAGMIPLASLLTPNIPEAEALIGAKIKNRADAEAAAHGLAALGAKAVLLKGGHMEGDVVTDILVEEGGRLTAFESPRIDSDQTHGTGCTLASAIATGLAQGLPLNAAVARARDYVLEAIRSAPGLGRGHGPLNHSHTVKPFP